MTKGFWSDFKAFAFKGNVIDLAVAVVIGAAFGAVTKSLVDDLIMPPLGVLIGGVDFDQLKYVLQAAGGEDQPEVAIMYGKFIQTVINFFIIALTVFMVIRTYTRLEERRKKAEVTEEPVVEEPKLSLEEELLTEIRDLLKSPNSPI